MASKIEPKALTMLQSIELTGDMEMKHLKKLSTMASQVEFAAGEIIYSKGDMGKALYLIEEGEVVIETDIPDQGSVRLNTLGPGQIFGWSSLFPPERKMFSTRATKPTRAIAINASQLRAAWQSDHELEYAIIRRAGQDMATRIKATRQRLATMVIQTQNI